MAALQAVTWLLASCKAVGCCPRNSLEWNELHPPKPAELFLWRQGPSLRSGALSSARKKAGRPLHLTKALRSPATALAEPSTEVGGLDSLQTLQNVGTQAAPADASSGGEANETVAEYLKSVGVDEDDVPRLISYVPKRDVRSVRRVVEALLSIGYAPEEVGLLLTKQGRLLHCSPVTIATSLDFYNSIIEATADEVRLAASKWPPLLGLRKAFSEAVALLRPLGLTNMHFKRLFVQNPRGFTYVKSVIGELEGLESMGFSHDDILHMVWLHPQMISLAATTKYKAMLQVWMGFGISAEDCRGMLLKCPSLLSVHLGTLQSRMELLVNTLGRNRLGEVVQDTALLKYSSQRIKDRYAALERGEKAHLALRTWLRLSDSAFELRYGSIHLNEGSLDELSNQR